MVASGRKDYLEMINRSDLDLNDSLLNMGSVFNEQKKGFFIETLPARELPYDNLFHNAITFEISLTNVVYYRRVYSVLDLMGDLGGLLGALTPLFFGIVKIFHYRSSYMHITGELFGTSKSSFDVGQYIYKPRNTIQWNCCRVSIFNLKLRMPGWCCCCKLSKQERLFEKSYRTVEKEVNITYIMRQIRALKQITQTNS